MSPTDIQQLHLSILLMLHAQGDVGMAEGNMLPKLRLEYLTLTVPQLAVQLRALADKKWVIEKPAVMGVVRWRITSDGTSQLQEAGQI